MDVGKVSGVLKALGRISITYVAYVCFLLGFVALGTFVYALATESVLAGVIGFGMVALMVVTVAGFRAGARRSARSNESGIRIDGANIFARPLRRDQIDHYLASYRGARREVSVESEPAAAVERRGARRAGDGASACRANSGWRLGNASVRARGQGSDLRHS